MMLDKFPALGTLLYTIIVILVTGFDLNPLLKFRKIIKRTKLFNMRN